MPANKNHDGRIHSKSGTHVRQLLVMVPSQSKNAGVVSNLYRNYLELQNNGPDAARYRFDDPCRGLRKGDISFPVGSRFVWDKTVPLESIYFMCDPDEQASITVIEGSEDHE